MLKNSFRIIILVLLTGALLLAACQPSAQPTAGPAETGAEAGPAVEWVTSDAPWPDTLEWVKVKAPENQYWELVDTGLDGAEAFEGQMIRLLPLNGAPEHEVFVIFAKKSSAYNTALTTIMTDFRLRGYAANFTVVNITADPAKTAAAVELALKMDADLIYSAGSDTTALLYAEFSDCAIPIVSVNSKDPVILGQMADYENGSGTSIAYTSLNVLMDVEINYLQQVVPDLKNIGILYAANNKSSIQTQAEPMRAAAEAEGIRVFDIVVDNVEDKEHVVAELVDELPPIVAKMKETDPDLAASIFWITGSTEVFDQIGTIDDYSGGVPVISVVPDVLHPGEDSAVLSIGVGFPSNALVASYYGIQILEGADPGSLPVGQVSPPDIAINFLKARQLGLEIPFSFFESANIVYDHNGVLVRDNGQPVAKEP